MSPFYTCKMAAVSDWIQMGNSMNYYVLQGKAWIYRHAVEEAAFEEVAGPKAPPWPPVSRVRGLANPCHTTLKFMTVRQWNSFYCAAGTKASRLNRDNRYNDGGKRIWHPDLQEYLYLVRVAPMQVLRTDSPSPPPLHRTRYTPCRNWVTL